MLIIEPKQEPCEAKSGPKVNPLKEDSDGEIKEPAVMEPQPEPSDLLSLLNLSEPNVNSKFPSSVLPPP